MYLRNIFLLATQTSLYSLLVPKSYYYKSYYYCNLIFLEILAINTRNKKLAYSINSRVGHEQLGFQFDNNTEVFGSCSLQWHNHFYVFGGRMSGMPRQVSMVNGNRLERKATLDFDFRYGACTILNQITIVLCFEYNETKVCRKSNNPYGSFTRLPNSNYDHRSTRIASIDGKNIICLTI